MSSILGNKLKCLRVKRHMTQKDIAKKLAIDRSTYSYYETGKTEPSLITLYKMSEVLKVPVQYLINPNFVVKELSGNDALELSDAQIEVLTASEQTLILQFRSLSEAKKKDVIAYMNNQSRTD